MEMVRLLFVCAAVPLTASAADFSLTIGPPVAAGPGAMKVKKTGAAFAVRLEECGAADQVQISGVAEGIVDGEHTTATVTVFDAGTRGVYIVGVDGDQRRGAWVASITASCGSAKAGAIVPLGPQGFVREGIKTLPRAATKAEIDSVLKGMR
jgi:hypothetical protein